jgi:IS5 family transposase
MGPRTLVSEGDLFRQALREQINLKHPLIRLADLIDWDRLSTAMSVSFVSHRGRPASSPRPIAGLLYLQHAFDLSEEDVLGQCLENPYWQIFTGETYLQTSSPIDPSSLTRWRKRLGEAGVEELLAETIEAAKRANVIKSSSLKRVIVDTTVMEKALTYPTDSRLLERCREHLVKAAARHGLKLRQNYKRKPYEFGVKVSIMTTHKEGLVVGARLMPGNPYDGHTLAEALEQASILSEVQAQIAVVDRGYKGVAIDGVKIYHPGLRRGITRSLRAMIRRRSAIEPVIGHMKAEGKLDRNWLKGALGDAMHAVLCGAGHNLRMILRKLRLFYALILLALLSFKTAAPSAA